MPRQACWDVPRLIHHVILIGILFIFFAIVYSDEELNES